MLELSDCTNTILREIATPELHRRDISQTYALAMRSSEKTDWAAVNKAIIARWSFAGLEWIKKQAHSGKCFAERRKPSPPDPRREVLPEGDAEFDEQ